MTVKVLALLLMTFLSTNLLSQHKESFSSEEKYPADSLQTWTAELMKELPKSHPGFYRYTTETAFDSIISSTINSFTDSLSTIEYYRRIKPLIAQIGCLHTSITLSAPYEDLINQKSKLIPIDIFITKDNQVFITKNHSTNNSLKPESQLLSINGKPIDEIVDILMKSIPSDGYNTTLKRLMLNHRFALWYRSIVDLNSTFEIQVKLDDTTETLTLEGVSEDQFESMETLQAANSDQLAFSISGNTGLLSIKSFAQTRIKSNGQHFKSYIKTVFKTLEKEQIKNLIIDLRYNSGGTDGNAAFISSHFFDQPFNYWESITVTEKIAKQIKGSLRIFYPKPEKIDSTYLWKGALLTKEFDYYKKQKPSKNNFKGNVYVLTNGLCMSSCSDFVAILSENSKAIIVGQETGGGYQGNTSGMMPTTAIHPNMMLTVPLQRYNNAVRSDKNFGRGTEPNYIVNPNLQQWINKEDVVMKFTEKLITNSGY